MAFTKGHKINLGKYKSKEVREKISLSQKKRLTDPQKRLLCKKARKLSSGNLGKKHSEEAKKKMSLAHKGQKKSINAYSFPSGDNHPKWIKDRTKLSKKQERNDSAYWNWAMIVKKRDNWKCRINNEDCKGKVIAHHILSWKDYPELRYNINNGITLCQAHHPLKRAEEKRLIPFFMDLMSVSKV